MEIAVVGGGLAGLVVAWRLAARHRVSLFERQPRPGLVAHTVEVPVSGRGGLGGGNTQAVETQAVDMPLRVFYPGYYPTLTRLYDHLGVPSEPVDYATTFTGDDGRAYFRWRNLRLGARAWPWVAPQDLRGRRAWRIVQGALQFHLRAGPALARGELAGRTLAAFVADEHIAPEFVNGLLLPAVATIGTCTHADAAAYPAEVVAAYHAGGLARQSVRRALHGANDVAQRLLAGVQRVVCDAQVQALRRAPPAEGGGVWLDRRGAAPERFDHAVFACQAPQARALLADATPAEDAALAGFRCRTVEVLMHSDIGFMPQRRGDWSPVHARVCSGADRPETTIWINAVQAALRHAAPVLQTVHPQREPRAGTLLGSGRFERSLVDAQSQQALAQVQRLHAEPGRCLWWAGAWAQPGVPLLESAAASAMAVADAVQAAAAGADRRAAQQAGMH